MKTRTRFTVYERAPRRMYTTDTRLSAEPGAYNPDMLGNVWSGYSKAKLDAMPDAAVLAAVKDTVTRAARYLDARRSRGRDDSPDERPEATFDLAVGAGASPQDLNDANRNIWDHAHRSAGRDSRPPDVSAGCQPEDINRANTAFWADYLGRPTSAPLSVSVRDRGRSSRPVTPEDINEANRAYWGTPSREQPFNRPFGKG